MPHRKGNKIRQVSDEELARQACDLWDKFAYIPVIARFLTLHDELDRRHGGKGGGARFINTEKKRRNAAKAAGYSPDFVPYDSALAGGGHGSVPVAAKPYPERYLLEMVGVLRAIRAITTDANITDLRKSQIILQYCNKALRNYPSIANEGKPDVRQDASGRKS